MKSRRTYHSGAVTPRLCSRLFFALCLVASGLAPIAVAAPQAIPGPRLSDAELLDAIDESFPGLSPVIALRSEGQVQSALKVLVSFVRSREEAADFGQQAARNPNSRVAAAEDTLRHKVVVVGIPHTFGPDIDWGFNPTTVPDSKHARDHEWTWQLNRHSAWRSLADAYQATGDERFAREFDAQFTDWVRECPVPTQGANQRPFSKWRTIEAGIRMSWTWPSIFTIFRRSSSVKDGTVIDMVKSMVEHARYLRLHPTSGNWLTMEMNGLYHVGVLLPFLREAESWRDFAATRLLAELDVQVYPDGAQIELTPGYHNVSLRSFLGLVEASRPYGYRLPGGYLDKLEKMFAYDLWAMRPDRDLPRWNDSWRVNARSILAQGFQLFPHRRDFQWIASEGREGTPPGHTSHVFPYAGQVVFRSDWGRDGLFLGFEAGPFGYGHQHEDKLGIVLFAYGRPLLVEGGSYAYDASPWRRYVLSSHAHNVVLVDAQGQARRGLPRRHYITREPVDAAFRSTVRLDYARGTYAEGFGSRDQHRARHEREVAFFKAERLFVVRDTLTPLDARGHSYQALFHLDAPEVVTEAERGTVETRFPTGANLRLVARLGDDLKTTIVRGQESPTVQGWLPQGHGIRGVRPTPTLIYERRSEGPVVFLTVLQPLRAGKEQGSEDRVLRVEGGEGEVRLTMASGRALDLDFRP